MNNSEPIIIPDKRNTSKDKKKRNKGFPYKKGRPIEQN